MELFILIVLLAVVFFIFRKFESLIYFIVISDIGLRIITFIKQNITSQEIYTFLNQYVPISIPSIIDKYTKGVVNEVLIWAYVVVFSIFLYYTIKVFLKKK